MFSLDNALNIPWELSNVFPEFNYKMLQFYQKCLPVHAWVPETSSFLFRGGVESANTTELFLSCSLWIVVKLTILQQGSAKASKCGFLHILLHSGTQIFSGNRFQGKHETEISILQGWFHQKIKKYTYFISSQRTTYYLSTIAQFSCLNLINVRFIN